MQDTLMPHKLSRLNRLELPFCLRCNRIQSRHVLRVFSTVSWLGNGPIWIAMTGLLLIVHAAEALPAVGHMFLTAAICLVFYKSVKKFTERPRPYDSRPGFQLTVAPLDRYSFPSGHTLHAVAFTLVLSAHDPWLFGLALPFTLLVAMSRVVLGLHYPSDVVAGAVFGGLIAYGVLQI